MRKIIQLSLLIFLLTIPINVGASQEPPDCQEALDMANKELEDIAYPGYFQMQNINNRPFNKNLYNTRTLFVYGEHPFKEFKKGHYRYLGYTMKTDDKFTNVKYPHDDWAGGKLEDRDWIPTPWDKTKVQKAFNIEKNVFEEDRNKDYRKSINMQIHWGLSEYYGKGTDKYSGPECYKGVNSDYFGEWYKYVHILQPPTEFTWGMGRMFHRKGDGSLWYLTVPITPGNWGVNLKTQITSAPDTAKPGSTVNVKGTVDLEGTETITSIDTKVQWRVNGEVIKEKNITVNKQDKVNVGLSFSMPNKDANVELEVNPDRNSPKFENSFKDNKSSALINVKAKNLAAKITSNPVEVQPGNTVKVTGQLTSRTDKPDTTKVRWTVNGSIEYEGGVTFTKKRDLNFSFTMPDNDTQVTVEVNPGHDKPSNESNWTDNKDNATIGKIAANPPSDPHLILQATSPAGKDIHGNYHPAEKRPQGVAKWGDTVKATLKPDKPSAPRGEVTSWEITSAKITYPKRHSDFTFGHPVQPVSNTTKAMTLKGHTAVKEFLQEWSINGYASGTSAAGVYDWIQEKTVSQYPREYPISAEYSIHYEYKYEVRHVDHDTWTDSEGNTHSDTDIWYETVRKDDSYSDAVSTKLLVNGAARVPLAH